MAGTMTEQGRKVTTHWAALAVGYDGAVAALEAAGVDLAAVKPADLHGIDMLHMGGLKAADALAELGGIGPGSRVLDVGAGVGGPSRRFADRYGAEVTSVELSAVLADTASRLNALVGLEGKVTVLTASALDLPVPDASFDVVTMQHVAMQISEKDRLFSELARVIRPGGRLALHEIFGGPGELRYPLAWADEPSMSALEPLETALDRLRGLGLVPGAMEDESEAGRQHHVTWIERWGAAADRGESLDGLAPAVLAKRVAASRAMEHNLRVGSLRVVRLVADRPG